MESRSTFFPLMGAAAGVVLTYRGKGFLQPLENWPVGLRFCWMSCQLPDSAMRSLLYRLHFSLRRRLQLDRTTLSFFGVSFKWLLLSIVAALLGNARAAWGRLTSR